MTATKDKKFEFLEHTADLKFRSYGKTLEECFSNAALALSSSLANLSNVAEKEEVTISLESDSLEMLLHDFLSEILFLFDTSLLILKKFQVNISEKDGKYELAAKCWGEKLNQEKHEIVGEIKAITYHDMKLEKINDMWVAEVLCDI